MVFRISRFVCVVGVCLQGAAAQSIGFTPVVSGLAAPTTVTNAGDGSGRLFIVEQPGRIRILQDGTLLPTPFLDISSQVLSEGEEGLLGLAFPPGYADNYFYVYYTSRAGAGDNVLARYYVTGDPDVADPGSEEILLTFSHRTFTNHNGGEIAFGPDGYLYLGPGDGGGGGDQLHNAQNLGVLLGKILRIDVESGESPYGIPPDNPFVGVDGAQPEIWAYGMRNPWRFSFDDATGDLYIADVGQDKYEEVDVQPAGDSGGENYGWPIMEGTHCYPIDDGSCDMDGLTLPVLDYDHSQGNCAIIGGYVYRGASYPSIQGIYFYGDLCSGRIWGLTPDGTSTELAHEPFQISSFGEDEDGNLYVSAYSTGAVYLITAQ